MSPLHHTTMVLSAQDAPVPDGAHLRLLCIEDNDADFRLLTETLRDASFQLPVVIRRAVRLNDALRVLSALGRADGFDVVLLDLSLPDSQGIETFEAIQAASPTTAIIILSGNSDGDLALSMVQLGAQDYLPKDALTPDMLSRSIQYASERQRLNLDLRELNKRLLAAQTELRTAQMQLIQAEKLDSLGRIAASVAHEVKNPLATLQMAADFFEATPDTTSINGRRMVECMQEAIKRAESIIHEMLDFSRSDEINFEPCGVNEVVASAVRMTQPELLERRVKVQENYCGEVPSVLADQGKLEQVLINLLINAAQAMPGGGLINIRTHSIHIEEVPVELGLREMDLPKVGDLAAVIEIRDFGPGIPADLMDRVFEPFFTTKPTGEGTGLGLPVAKRIIEMHRGYLHAFNAAAPSGLCVRITLKAHAPKNAPTFPSHPHTPI